MVQVASLFSQLLQQIPRTEFAGSSRSTRPSVPPRDSPAGRSSSRCCSANWPAPIPCGRSATAWPAAWASWCIWALTEAPSRSTLSYANEHRPAALYEDLFWTAAGPLPRQQATGRHASTSSVSRTSCCRWIRRRFACA